MIQDIQNDQHNKNNQCCQQEENIEENINV